MSTMQDKYNIINREIFRSDNPGVILENILTNNTKNFDLEKLLVYSQENSDFNLNVIIKDIIKRFKNQLKYQIRKDKIDIDKFIKRTFEIMSKLQLIYILSKNGTIDKTDKLFGKIPEISFFESFSRSEKDFLIDLLFIN